MQIDISDRYFQEWHMGWRNARAQNRIISLLVLCILLSSACLLKRSKHKYFYPDGYIGWSRINFKKDAPMPPMEDGAYIFKFTPAGELDISYREYAELGGAPKPRGKEEADASNESGLRRAPADRIVRLAGGVACIMRAR
jgi:hypothetical protein